MTRRALICLSLLLATSAVAAGPGDTDLRVFVPGVARAAGYDGSSWRTTLWIVNPAAREMTLRLAFRPGPGFDSGGGLDRYDITLGPNGALSSDDVLGTLFQAVSDTAGLLIVQTGPSDPTPLVAARTYNLAADGGTFGQFIRGVEFPPSPSRAVTMRWIAGLTGNDEFRTNVGLVNLDTEETRASVNLEDPVGTHLAGAVLDLPLLSWQQLNKVNDVVGVGPRDLFQVLLGIEGSWYGYASRVDQRTGDPTFIPADLAPRDLQWIDGVARQAGASGTFYRSTLCLRNPDEVPRTATIEYLPIGQPEPAASEEVSLLGGEFLFWDDVLFDLFGLADGNGTLVVRSQGLVAWVRTYNDDDSGTYGQLIPGFDTTDTITAGRSSVIPGLSQAIGMDGYRSNAGFVNLGGGDAVVLLEAISRSGSTIGSKEIEIPAGQSVRINRILAQLGAGGSFSDSRLLISPQTGGAAVYAWASIVDNRTGDAIFVPHFPTE